MSIAHQDKSLPNLIIIGAQKCGTTSLHYYLSKHPEIYMSRQKELNFFNEGHGWKKGLKWYKSNFISDAKIRGETSPHYTLYPYELGVPQKMFSVVPWAKLIYIVRNPIERMISKYLSFYKVYGETRSFEEFALPIQGNRYVNISKYFMQLEQYLRYFPLSRILILITEELKAQRRDTLKKVFRFLTVDAAFDCPEYEQMLNVADKQPKRVEPDRKPRRHIRYLKSDKRSARIIRAFFPPQLKDKMFQEQALKGEFVDRPVVSPALRAQLEEAFSSDIEKLRQLTGLKFDQWFS